MGQLLTDAKAYLEITNNDHDALIQQIIDGVLGSAHEYMGRSFSQVSGAVQYADGGQDFVYVPSKNVSVSTVEIQSGTDWEVLDSDYWVLDPSRGVVRTVGYRFPSGQRNVRVTYNGGYAEASLPAGFRAKIAKQAAYEFRRRKDPGLTATTYPDGSVQKWSLDEWLPDVKAELDRHRRIVL
jgi:hypothetical protein